MRLKFDKKWTNVITKHYKTWLKRQMNTNEQSLRIKTNPNAKKLYYEMKCHLYADAHNIIEYNKY